MLRDFNSTYFLSRPWLECFTETITLSQPPPSLFRAHLLHCQPIVIEDLTSYWKDWPISGGSLFVMRGRNITGQATHPVLPVTRTTPSGFPFQPRLSLYPGFSFHLFLPFHFPQQKNQNPSSITNAPFIGFTSFKSYLSQIVTRVS